MLSRAWQFPRTEVAACRLRRHLQPRAPEERGGIMSQEQLEAIIQQLKANPILEQPSVEGVRAGFEQLGAMFPVPGDVQCEPIQAGSVKAEWITAPGAAADRAILYLHGGGYVIGSINTHRALAAALSQAAKSRVLAIDYRLSPQEPHSASGPDAARSDPWLFKPGPVSQRLS